MKKKNEKLRDITPQRSSIRQYSNYRRYKPYLRKDFYKRCGYCNDLDIYCNGQNGYQIDHFIPLTPFEDIDPSIKTNYSNLVYSCPYCNSAKSNKWPSGDIEIPIINNEGFVDPCNLDYENHFQRESNGKIIPISNLGNYMYQELKLGLRRHQLLWAIEKLKSILDEINEALTNKDFDNIPSQILRDYYDLVKNYREYEDFFYQEL